MPQYVVNSVCYELSIASIDLIAPNITQTNKLHGAAAKVNE